MKALHCGPCDQCKTWRRVEFVVLGSLLVATMVFVMKEFS